MIETNLDEFENWVQTYISSLKPAQAQMLMRKIGKAIQKQNRLTMTAQTTPDGEKWQARKSKSRRKMFVKLKLNRNLKVKVLSNGVSVGFHNRTAFIARVHHYGLKEKHGDNPNITYAERRLIGITEESRQAVNDLILEHMGAAS